jgi:hypothetical protein
LSLCEISDALILDALILNEVVAAVLVAKPAVVGIEVRDAIEAAAKDVTEVAVTDAIGVGTLDVAEEATTDAGPLGAAAAVADESRVLDEFVVARGGSAVGLAASEVVVEAGPVESLAERAAAAGVELGEPRAERAAFQVVRGGSAVDLGGFQVGSDDCPDESWVGLDDFQADPVGWVARLVGRGG